jgi:hypothetical protein
LSATATRTALVAFRRREREREARECSILVGGQLGMSDEAKAFTSRRRPMSSRIVFAVGADVFKGNDGGIAEPFGDSEKFSTKGLFWPG